MINHRRCRICWEKKPVAKFGYRKNICNDCVFIRQEHYRLVREAAVAKKCLDDYEIFRKERDKDLRRLQGALLTSGQTVIVDIAMEMVRKYDGVVNLCTEWKESINESKKRGANSILLHRHYFAITKLIAMATKIQEKEKHERRLRS